MEREVEEGLVYYKFMRSKKKRQKRSSIVTQTVTKYSVGNRPEEGWISICYVFKSASQQRVFHTK